MNTVTLRRRLSEAGPFVVKTSDGGQYTVRHPEFVKVGRFNLVIESDDGAIDVIDPMHGCHLACVSRPSEGEWEA